MKIVLSVVSICLLLIVQLAFQNANLFVLAPNFILVYLCVWLLLNDLEETLWLGLFAGVLLDVFSGLPDGILAFSVPLSLSAARYIGLATFNERFSAFLLPFYAFCATIAFFVATLLVLGGLVLLGWVQSPAWQHFLTAQLLIAIVLNLIALIPSYGLYIVQEKIQKRYWPKHESI